MKKALSVLLCLILVLGCFPLTAMADTTIEGNGETSISLTTGVPELASITVTPPTKTEYNIGDELDTTGIVVMANYNYTEDTPKDVTSAVTLSGFDSSAAGEVTVTVSYTEKEITKIATFSVTIVEPVVTTYTIAVSADPAEGGTVTGGGTYAENESVTVTATANSNYIFVKWTENGDQVSTSDSYTFTATTNRTLVAVFEPEQVIYTVTIEPGEGTGTAFTVDSTTILTQSDIVSGNYDQTKGCFFRYNGEDTIYYRLPQQCPFTAPEWKEFDCWEVSNSQGVIGAWSSGGNLDIASTGNLTVTALWSGEVPSHVTLSIPATIDVKYGDTETAFDLQVKEVVFEQGQENLIIVLNDSAFISQDNNSTIPFTVTCNGLDAERSSTFASSRIYTSTELPYSYQGFIHITTDDWTTAKPGSYTAMLKLEVGFW